MPETGNCPWLRDLLSGGDRRSIGRVPEVVTIVGEDPSRIDELVAALTDDDAVVRMRAADALEKVTAAHPAGLAPHKQTLLELAAIAEQMEIRWHLAQIVPRLELTLAEREKAFTLLQRYLSDRSSIVKTFTLQALFNFVATDRRLLGRVTSLLRAYAETGTPAMRSRSRRLLAALKDQDT